MRELILLLNGLTDHLLQDLHGRTPLEVARHPFLDQLLAAGEVRLLDFPSESSVEERFTHYLGAQGWVGSRASLEALALGYPLHKGERAFCLQFASAGGEVIHELSDHLLSDVEGGELCLFSQELMEGWGCKLFPVAGPYALFISRYPGLQPIAPQERLSPLAIVGQRWDSLLPPVAEPRWLKGVIEQLIERITSHEINRLREELEEPTINACILSEGGHREESFSSVKPLSSTALVGRSLSWKGMAQLYGMTLYPPPEEREKYAILPWIFSEWGQWMEKHERVIIDLPYLWEATYRGELLNKIKAIEFLDRALIQPLSQEVLERGGRFTLVSLQHMDIRTGSGAPGPLPHLSLPAQEPSGLTPFQESTFESLLASPRKRFRIRSR